MDDGGEHRQESTLDSGKNSYVQSQLSSQSFPKIPISPNLEAAIKYELEHGRTLDPNMDNKKFRRTISNRLASSRARIKQARNIIELENKVKNLQVTTQVISCQIENEKNYQKKIKKENELLQQKIEKCKERSNLSNVIMKERIAEIERLKEIQEQQEVESWINCDLDSESEQITTSNTDQSVPPSLPNLNLDRDDINQDRS